MKKQHNNLVQNYNTLLSKIQKDTPIQNYNNIKYSSVMFDTGILTTTKFMENPFLENVMWYGNKNTNTNTQLLLDGKMSPNFLFKADFTQFGIDLEKIQQYITVVPTLGIYNPLTYKSQSIGGSNQNNSWHVNNTPVTANTDMPSPFVANPKPFPYSGWCGPTKHALAVDIDNNQLNIAYVWLSVKTIYATDYEYWYFSISDDTPAGVWIKLRGTIFEVETRNNVTFDLNTVEFSSTHISGVGYHNRHTRNNTWDMTLPSPTPENTIGVFGPSTRSNIPGQYGSVNNNTYEVSHVPISGYSFPVPTPGSYNNEEYPLGQWTIVYEEPEYLHLESPPTGGNSYLLKTPNNENIPTSYVNTNINVAVHPLAQDYTYMTGVVGFRYHEWPNAVDYVDLKKSISFNYEKYEFSIPLDTYELPLFTDLRTSFTINDTEQLMLISGSLKTQLTDYFDDLIYYEGLDDMPLYPRKKFIFGENFEYFFRLQIIYTGPYALSQIQRNA